MKKVKAVVGILIPFAFVVLGIWGLTNADTGGQRLMFAGVVAFFGGGLAIELADLLPPVKPVETADGGLIVRTSFLRILVLGLGCFGFVFLGGLMAIAGWQGSSAVLMVVGVTALLFGGVFLLFLIRRLFAAGTEYVITPAGIESRIGIRWRLAWGDIQAVGLGSAGMNQFIVLETYSDVPDPRGILSRINRKFGMPPYSIAPFTNGVDIPSLAELIHDMAAAAQPPEQEDL